MKTVFVIYDDRKKPNQEICQITGGKSFGNTIFKRKTLKERMKEEIILSGFVKEVRQVESDRDLFLLKEELEKAETKTTLLVLPSNFGIRDREAFKILLKKASYIQEIYAVACNGKASMWMYPDISTYLKGQEGNRTAPIMLESDAFIDFSEIGHFRTFLTGGFDARYFNALTGDEFTVTKGSGNKEKIRAEYEFYYLLPDEMKYWFVMPFGYEEWEDGASYKMERYHMTDIAIRFVHGAVSMEEFRDILDKLFYFLRVRKEKKVTREEYERIGEKLYIEKVDQRIEMLKQKEEYKTFDNLIRIGTDYDGISGIVKEYKRIYRYLSGRGDKEEKLVVGHGDLCFSNILYSRDVSLLKLIDPKGAMKEDDLYTHPYYDLAKLSHSIWGSYDFFNSGLFQITIEGDMKFCLSMDTDNTAYGTVFGEYLKKHGYDPIQVRLYEASLFLSMLPLHMDQENKVFAFLLNAMNIMEELKKYV